MNTWENMRTALDRIQRAKTRKKICVGFDGYVDTLYRVVKERRSADDFDTYATIGEFADRAHRAAGRSADMELQPVSRRMGGNAPLMAEAMACLGLSARCIGTMGYPEPEEVFSGDRIHFAVSSVAPCAASMAFEFTDGKLMFGDTQPLLTLNWERIVEIVGLENIRQWYRDCGLWAIVNWSFVLNCNDIIAGFMRDVVECRGAETKKILFFDLADPSGRSRQELLRLGELLGRLNNKPRVVLSMNENESLWVAAALDLPGEEIPAQQRASAIREKLGIYLASIHGMDYAVAATEEGAVRMESIYNPDPVISTGGGDHFNGGFAVGLLHGLEPVEALAFGNLVSSCYVSHGHSPSLPELADYIAACK